ncbi:MAG: hypothetical protein OEY89_17505 [Gammaproteobacteria bacterium]|nr:hypothetical protein [Gammaproteobacteria bacterium]
MNIIIKRNGVVFTGFPLESVAGMKLKEIAIGMTINNEVSANTNETVSAVLCGAKYVMLFIIVFSLFNNIHNVPRNQPT